MKKLLFYLIIAATSFLFSQELKVSETRMFELQDVKMKNIVWRPTLVQNEIKKELNDYVYVSNDEVIYSKNGSKETIWEGTVYRNARLRWNKNGGKVSFIGFNGRIPGIVVYDFTTSITHFIIPPEGHLGNSYEWFINGDYLVFTGVTYEQNHKYPGNEKSIYKSYVSKYNGEDIRLIGRGSVEDVSPVNNTVLLTRGEEESS